MDLIPGPYVRLSVIDTGTGMDTDTQRHMFEPFFTTKEPGTGIGLGLSTVYGIVRQSGDAVGVSSDVGRGTTLTLYFPGTGPATTGTTAAPTTSAALGGTERILIVEDEEAVRRLMRSALKRRGYRVLLVPDGCQALDLLASQADAIDLVISNIVMPHMNGPDFVKRMLEQWLAMRVLFMSGYARGTVPHQVATDLAAQFIAKPFALTELLARVRKVLDQPRSLPLDPII
ncbi:MAG TPA: response regulator [Gemmatimonadaceae bacterium]|nr:response regulator [Gemmatimonadaceae bacterium]